MSLKEKVKQKVSKELVQIFLKPQVRQTGKEFVVDLINQPETRTAVINLLQDVLNDKRFIYHSTLWATDLLTKVVLEDSVIKSTQILTEKLLKQDQIVEGTVQLVKYVTQRQEAMDIVSEYYKKVFKRVDVKESVKELLAEGAYQGLADPKTVKKFSHFIVRVVNDEQVKDAVFDTYVYKPVRNVFSYFTGK